MKFEFKIAAGNWNLRSVRRSSLSLFLSLWGVAVSSAQNREIKLPVGTLQELNKIQYGDSLRLVRWNEQQLRSQQQGFPFQILHIGDSHLQGGPLANAARSQFQSILGNGGLGITFPYSAAKTYTPRGYRTSFVGKFEFAKSFSLPPKLPMGLMGATVKTKDARSELHFTNLPKPPLDSKYIIEIWADGTDSMFQIQVRDGLEWKNMTVVSRSPFSSLQVEDTETHLGADSTLDRVELLTNTWEIPRMEFEDWKVFRTTVDANDSISVRFQKINPTQTQIELYGVNIYLSSVKSSISELDTSFQPAGMLYHNAGMGGARYESLLYESLLNQQLQYLNPAVVILDLGTNDIAPLSIFPERLREQIELSIDIVQQSLPNALVLLATPMDMEFRGRKVTHTYPLAEMCKEIAQVKGCLLWNFYWLAGAKGSLPRWQDAKLVSADGIHMTEPGYSVKGNLLATALLDFLSSVKTGNLQSNLWLNEDSVWLVWNGILPPRTVRKNIRKINPSAKSEGASTTANNGSMTAVQAPNKPQSSTGKTSSNVNIPSPGNSNTKPPNPVVAKSNSTVTTNPKSGIPAQPVQKSTPTPFGDPKIVARPPQSKTNLVNSGSRVIEKKVRHTVKPGEDIFDIAYEFGVSVAQIKKWNGLNSNVLRPGKVIVIVKSAPIGSRR